MNEIKGGMMIRGDCDIQMSKETKNRGTETLHSNSVSDETSEDIKVVDPVTDVYHKS